MRDGAALLIYAQALIVTGATEAQARARYEEYRRHIDIEAALVLLSAWTGVGFSRFALDACAVAHDSMRDVVELVVPELQRRGRYRSEYGDGGLRQQLLGRGARLPEEHPGRQVSIAIAGGQTPAFGPWC